MRVLPWLLVAGCVPVNTESRCDPGPFWDGISFENPAIGAAGETLIAVWRELDSEGSTLIDAYVGAAIDPSSALTPITFEEGLQPRSVLSGPDRVVVTGELAGGGSFAQIRLASGEVVSTLEGTGIGVCAFDGQAFLIRLQGNLVPMALDGTVGSPLALPPDFAGACHITGDTIWVVSETGEDEPVLGVRIANQVVLDTTPRTLVETAPIFVSIGSRPGELAVVTQDRDDVRVWRTFGDDGSVLFEGPAVLETDVYIAKQLIGETDDYLWVGFDNELIRIAPDGAQRGPALVEDRYAINNVRFARTTGATSLVFDATRPRGTAPQVGTMRIEDGGDAGVIVAIETSEGAPYTVDCGCSTGGGQGLFGILALAGLASSRRSRRAAAPSQHRATPSTTAR